jgi:transposase
VTRQTLYNWMARFEEGGSGALQDQSGRGRPTLWTEPLQRFLEWSMTQPPEALGYASVDWTTDLLRQHLAKWMGVDVSDTTLRAQLHRLGYVWKRPRYVLQPDPEREKKNAGFGGKSSNFLNELSCWRWTKPTCSSSPLFARRGPSAASRRGSG